MHDLDREPVSLKDLELDQLPLQKELVRSAHSALSAEDDVVAAVLLGSLAAGKGDRVSDADIIAFTQNDFHRTISSCLACFEADKEIFYSLDGSREDQYFFKKYIFTDLTSAEIHFMDASEPFSISRPFKVLFDKGDIVASRLTDEPAPKHKDFPVYTSGDEGLIWELFDCIKWLSRDDK
ncbi:MAG: hypothetical protein LAT62_08915, partial [Natronospirillum sp.]|uniref:hypothetical protein n=1 Tax=Natronospirillum sp. TaxID=2812955 RepID=UPI0025EFD9EF